MASAENAEQHGPLDQFTIRRYVDIDLGGFDASFTNSSLLMVVAVIVIFLLTTLGMGRGRMVPGRLQSVVEMLYEMIAGMLGDIVGITAAARNSPLSKKRATVSLTLAPAMRRSTGSPIARAA